jgi:hypothetical protein
MINIQNTKLETHGAQHNIVKTQVDPLDMSIMFL